VVIVVGIPRPRVKTHSPHTHAIDLHSFLRTERGKKKRELCGPVIDGCRRAVTAEG
jgi:hypothetical protein